MNQSASKSHVVLNAAYGALKCMFSSCSIRLLTSNILVLHLYLCSKMKSTPLTRYCKTTWACLFATLHICDQNKLHTVVCWWFLDHSISPPNDRKLSFCVHTVGVSTCDSQGSSSMPCSARIRWVCECTSVRAWMMMRRTGAASRSFCTHTSCRKYRLSGRAKKTNSAAWRSTQGWWGANATL